jgi:hypothetical protein
MSDPIIVAMASFPPRKAGMLRAVADLLPQCDVLRLYLNGYSERPPELPNDAKLDVILAGPECTAPDVGSHGKFHWLGAEAGYYLSVDDDILYPPDYAKYLVEAVDRYQRKAIVGLHGGVYRIRNGAPMPARNLAKDNRVLYGYDHAISRDIGVHILGAGVMASYPQALGLTRDVCTGPIHSGDDEDIAVWAQRTHTPLIRLRGANKWILPNPKEWIKDPLHRRANYIRESDKKLKAWPKWTIPSLPAVPVVAKATVIKQQVQKPRAQIPQVQGPDFSKIVLSAETEAFCNKILSSDALAAMIVHRLKHKVPTSVVRMSDGERAIIAYSRGEEAPKHFLKDPAYLKRIGLVDCDLKALGSDLLWAGNHADFLACTISGIFWADFLVHPYFPERDRFIDQFYPELWQATGRVGPVLNQGGVLILHGDAERLATSLQKRYKHPDITGVVMTGWRDHKRITDVVEQHHAGLVLLSGGAPGKGLAVRLAQATGKVVLDLGNSLANSWLK